MDNLNKLYTTLSTFKRMIRFWFFTTGCCYVIVSASLFMFASLLLDRAFRFDWSQRLICLFIGISYLAIVVYRHIIKPVFDKISDEYLCLSIEKRKPELGQKITSGYQLANMDQPEVYGYSRLLVESAIKESIRAIESFQIKELIDNKLRLKLLLCGFFAVGLSLVFMVSFSNDFSIWYQRNILLKSIKWPRKTILKVENIKPGNKIFVPEGDPFVLKVSANSAGSIPDIIKIKVSKKNKDYFYLTNLTGINEYLYRFEKVSSNFSFVVYGGDDESETIQVITIQKPEIDSIKFISIPPTYTGLPEVELLTNQSSWTILENGSIKINGVTNKNIEKLELFFNGTSKLNIPATIKGKEFIMILGKEELKSGTYEIKAFDENGIAKEPGLNFSLLVVQDKLPEAGLKLDYNSEILTAQAILPCDWIVKDDYGALNGSLSISVLGKEEKTAESKKIKLFESKNKSTKLFGNQINLELSDLKLKPSQQILIFLEASDYFNRNPDILARSVVNRLSVVSVEDFEKYTFDKEQELRVEIERLKKEEENLQISAASIKENIRLSSVWGNNEIKEMMSIEKKQKLMEQRNERVITKFNQLLSDIQTNKIDDENLSIKKRIDNKIKVPLTELNERYIPLALQLSLEVRNLEKIDKKIDILNELQKLQKNIIFQYSEILKSMRKWEGYYETVGLLKEIIKEQKDLKDKTETKTKENIKGVFDE